MSRRNGNDKKDFDGWIEFVEKIVKADKEETARLYLERTQLWVDKLQKNLEIMPSGDIAFAIAALHIITEGIEKENPEATAISKRLINGIDFETKSGTIHDMTEAAARTYFESNKKRNYLK